jgi:2Fe-2S ferredoxin
MMPLPEMNDDEEAMLSEAFYVKSTASSHCQICPESLGPTENQLFQVLICNL